MSRGKVKVWFEFVVRRGKFSAMEPSFPTCCPFALLLLGLAAFFLSSWDDQMMSGYHIEPNNGEKDPPKGSTFVNGGNPIRLRGEDHDWDSGSQGPGCYARGGGVSEVVTSEQQTARQRPKLLKAQDHGKHNRQVGIQGSSLRLEIDPSPNSKTIPHSAAM